MLIALEVSLALAKRMLEALALIEVPVKEKLVKVALFGSATTAPVVLMLVVPAEVIRSPIIETAPVAEPALVAPMLEVLPEVEVTTPSAPPSIVTFPVLAKTSKPMM
jgi:hypothetical protein